MKEIILNHPLVTHKLSILRNKNTGTKEFREIISEISTLLCYEATKDAVLEKTIIETPLEKYETESLNEDKYAFVPILRAGMSMVDGIIKVIPNAKIGHIGLYRNEETLEPQLYYAKFPPTLKEATVFLVDPMLATGGSAVAAIDILKSRGAKKIIYIGIVGVNEGIENLQKHHPDVDIYLAAKDEKLNENGYIVPGLGDCGDRIFGTK